MIDRKSNKRHTFNDNSKNDKAKNRLKHEIKDNCRYLINNQFTGLNSIQAEI